MPILSYILSIILIIILIGEVGIEQHIKHEPTDLKVLQSIIKDEIVKPILY